MLERYFVRQETLARIRSSWMGPVIERYSAWLCERGYRVGTLPKRVSILRQFGTFAQRHGARDYEELPAHLESFLQFWLHQSHPRRESGPPPSQLARHTRVAIEQMLRVVVPGFVGRSRRHAIAEPFSDRVRGFFTYLREERGLRDATLDLYASHLRQFDTYLTQHGISQLSGLSVQVLRGFLTDQDERLQRSYVRLRGTVLRVFVRYLHREGLLARDLSAAVDTAPVYRLATIPRAITANEVQQMLAAIDRHTLLGRRDYAMLLLLVSYGLRAREVAALTLEDVDWCHDRLRVPERKAGHSSAYPLSPLVGGAIVDYLQARRHAMPSRHVFLRVTAPWNPVTHVSVARRAAHYLHKAGIAVPRAGSHTLRHTCVQRLVEAGWSLKQIGDYVGHRSAASTEIYSKVAIDKLRDVACGIGEEVL